MATADGTIEVKLDKKARDAMKQRSGWHSTKLHLALITMATVTAVYVMMGCPVAAFDHYCMALITAAGIYSVARVSESFAQRPQKSGANPSVEP